MRIARAIIGAIALGSLFCAGCKLGVKKAIDDHRAGVETTIALTQKIGSSLASVPPVTKDGMTIPGPVLFASDVNEKELSTATIIYAEDIAELTAPVDHSASRLTRANLLTECATILKTGRYHSTSPDVHPIIVRSYLSKCQNLKYVFVLRSRKSEAREFAGDLLAYDLATGKNLGGLALAIQSEGLTTTVTNTNTTTSRGTTVTGRTTTTKTTTTTTGLVNHDESQLRSEMNVAITNGIKKYVPTARFVD